MPIERKNDSYFAVLMSGQPADLRGVRMHRLSDLARFYVLLDALEEKVHAKRSLMMCSGKMVWPKRGVYFFFETGESRSDSGSGPRVVRVGTHALREGSRAKLWTRLSQHQGTITTGGGNHRGSIFREIVGTALIRQEGKNAVPTWGQGSTATGEVRGLEQDHENRVSAVIRAMPFLWVAVDDEPGRGSLRGFIERNAIGLLSNYARDAIDAPSPSWLGRFCDRGRVRGSGLWNQDHVDADYDPRFLDDFDTVITWMK
jgi:hypothetical protein